MKTDEKRFSGTLKVRCPARITPLIDRAAQRKCSKRCSAVTFRMMS
jgi:hypothetical protein